MFILVIMAKSLFHTALEKEMIDTPVFYQGNNMGRRYKMMNNIVLMMGPSDRTEEKRMIVLD